MLKSTTGCGISIRTIAMQFQMSPVRLLWMNEKAVCVGEKKREREGEREREREARDMECDWTKWIRKFQSSICSTEPTLTKSRIVNDIVNENRFERVMCLRVFLSLSLCVCLSIHMNVRSKEDTEQNRDGLQNAANIIKCMQLCSVPL